jgi:hypothetical protein
MSFLGIIGAGLGSLAGGGCIDLAIFSLGCSVEQSTRSRNKLENSITTNVSTNARSSIEQTAVVNALVDITNGPSGRVECKGFNVGNAVTGNVQFVANSNQQVVATIQETLNQALDNAVKSLSTQQTEYLSKAANGKNITEVVNEMKTAINTNMSTSVINDIRQNIQVGSTIKFKNDGLVTGDTCNFTNNVALNLFSSAVVSQAVQSVLQLEDVQNIINYVENDVKIDNKGLGGLLKSLTPILIILGVLALIGFLFWVWSLTRQPKPQILPSAATAATIAPTFFPLPANYFQSLPSVPQAQAQVPQPLSTTAIQGVIKS